MSGKGGRRNSLGLTERQLAEVLEDLDSGGGGDHHPQRRFVRYAHRVDGVHLKIRQPDGQSTVVRVACRNLSRGGISVLHSSFVHPGSRCALVLQHKLDGMVVVEGEVMRCQHRRGLIHELGIRFKSPINPRDFADIESLGESFSLERVDPDQLEGVVVHLEPSELDQRVFQHFLRGSRLRYRAATTADDAYGFVVQGCDVLVLEYWLGDETSIELLRRLRDEGSRTPVIVATSESSPEAKREMQGAGVRELLLKPLSQERVLQALAEVLVTDREIQKAGNAGKVEDAPRELVDEFIKGLAPMADELERAMSAMDPNACTRVAMRVHGVAPTLGFGALAELARDAAKALNGSHSVEDSMDPLRTLLSAMRKPRQAA